MLQGCLFIEIRCAPTKGHSLRWLSQDITSQKSIPLVPIFSREEFAWRLLRSEAKESLFGAHTQAVDNSPDGRTRELQTHTIQHTRGIKEARAWRSCNKYNSALLAAAGACSGAAGMRFQKRRVHFERPEINYSGLTEGNFNCTRSVAAGAARYTHWRHRGCHCQRARTAAGDGCCCWDVGRGPSGHASAKSLLNASSIKADTSDTTLKHCHKNILNRDWEYKVQIYTIIF